MKVTGKFTIAKEPDYKTVGENNTPLLKLFLIENVYKGTGEEREKVDTNGFPAIIWGEKASEASIELDQGDFIHLPYHIKDGKYGEYARFDAIMEEDSYERDGERISTLQIVIFDYELLSKKGESS